MTVVGCGIASSFLTRVMRETRTALARVDFVQAVNLVYHELEANCYDREHEQIWMQGTGIWKKLLDSSIVSDLPVHDIEILDFGSGTGFAAVQLINNLGCARVKSVTIVEPSDRMAKICIDRLGEIGISAVRLASIPDNGYMYDVVSVNSVLHHVPSPVAVISKLGRFVRANGFCIVAQEPNALFHSSFIGGVNIRARSFLANSRRTLAKSEPSLRMQAVSKELVRRDITPVAMKPSDIGFVVDFWVPRPSSPERSMEKLGFTVENINEALGAGFITRRAFTYDFLGKPRVKLPGYIRFIDDLARFIAPQSGQQLAAVFQAS